VARRERGESTRQIARELAADRVDGQYLGRYAHGSDLELRRGGRHLWHAIEMKLNARGTFFGQG